MMSGLDIHYDLGDGHPLLGRRMPDLDVLTNDGMVRVFTLLHDARGVLLNLGAPITGTSGWSHRVDAIDAEYVGVLDLPAIGVVDAPPGDSDQAGWLRRLGRRRYGGRAQRRAAHVVRATALQRRGLVVPRRRLVFFGRILG
ncbi:hypothetical protein DSM43276_03306 [Mycobacteroides salmoniphilum]|nr:hypothetical protein DSM43276_03306 [Mycobacteroides salmoniphilum]